MRKLFKRFVAYFIDILVISIITQCLSGIPGINRQLDDYNKCYKEYITLYSEWVTFKSDLIKDYEDEKLDKEEYEDLVKEHEKYADKLDKYYIDGKLNSSNYEKLVEEIDKDYNKSYKQIYYKIEQNSIVSLIIYLVAVIGYFVLFNVFTKGQTLGKKLMRLKIVNSKDESRDVPVWGYIVRAIILYQPIYYLVRLIGINFMDANMYLNVTNIIYSIQGYLEMLIIAMMMIRLDGRGPQDFLARTRVVLYDRNGNEIQDKVNTIINDRIEKVIGNSKEVIDEENASKEQTKKNVSNKKKSKKVIDEEPTK